MIRWIPIIAVALLLSGCGGGTVPALAALGASAVTVGGSFALSAAKEDVAEAAEWRGKQKELVAKVLTAMTTRARSLEEKDFDAALELYKEALEFNEKQQPLILLERLGRRLKPEPPAE